MNEVGTGNFDLGLENWPAAARPDEIGTLNRGFIKMVTNLKRLVEGEYLSRIRLHEAQFRALQAQINPHFMFNTIQAVGTLALRHDARDIYDTTIALSGILRYALNPEQADATVEQELENVRQYLEIQSLRFGERLQISWTLAPEANSVRMPRLILQPIVENSIVHGIENTQLPLEVHIVTRHQDSSVEIEIEDSGPGIDESTGSDLAFVLAAASDNLSGSTHIGLRNVSERLRLYSGGRATLRLVSVKERGTRILISLPVVI
jgi:two-component system, sensor histidine kinase YesM